MKILISGSSGFLGKILVDGLKDFNLQSIGRKSANYICDLEFETCDLGHFDLVVHAAGIAHRFSNDPRVQLELYNGNINITKNFIKSFRIKPTHFVFISSVSVYGLTSGILINEDSGLIATDCYGKSKIDSEKLLEEWCKNNGIILTILRLPLVVGYNPPGNLGAMISAIKHGFYFNIDGGKAKKSMVLGSDVVSIILKASSIGGIYNLTDGIHPSFGDLSTVISQKLGVKKSYNIPIFLAKIIAFISDVIGGRLPIDSVRLSKITSDLTFDDTKARTNLKWKPLSVLENLEI